MNSILSQVPLHKHKDLSSDSQNQHLKEIKQKPSEVVGPVMPVHCVVGVSGFRPSS